MQRNLFGRAVMFAFGLTAVMVCNNVVADIIDPMDVPGKEYSNNPDENAAGGADSLQNIGWNGDGTTNGFSHDYSGSGADVFPVIPFAGQQVDAIANVTDDLFFEMVNNQVPFVVSFEGSGNIYFHDVNDATGLWAAGPTQIDSASPPDDVDGLEIWGETEPDANNFSLIGDPALGSNPAVSVYGYYDVGGVSVPYINKSQVQGALFASAGNLGITINPGDLATLDVDAMMVYDQNPQEVSWNPGDTIVFSVAPIDVNGSTLFDGGELFVWENGQPIKFLVHGGRTWDTANDVAGLFGVATENINALEAIVPEPTTALTGILGILAIGLFTLAGRNR